MANSKSTKPPTPVLTDQQIKGLKPTGRPYRVRDGLKDPTIKGLGVVVSASGGKSFYLAYTSPEITNPKNSRPQRRFLILGVYPTLSIKQARDGARIAREKVRAGIDPMEERERQQAAATAREELEKAEAQARTEGSVDRLFELYTKDLEMDGKRSAAEVRRIWGHDLQSELGGMPAAEVTTDHCSDIIADVAERGPVMANRVRSYLVAAFNFGLKCRSMPRWRRKAPDFQLQFNPAALTEKAVKQEAVGQRSLTEAEVRRLWGTMGVEALSADLALAVKMLLGTGQRVEEVLQATWSEFDLQAENGAVWVIPAARRKNRNKNLSQEPHLVPLTDFHLELLEEVKTHSGHSKWLFPRRDRQGPRTAEAFGQAVRRFCTPRGGSARAGMEPFSPRDLRRTWKTLAGSIELDLTIRNRVQGHAFSDVGSRSYDRYDRYDYFPQKRAAMERWSGWLQEVVTAEERKTDSNVVAFGERHG